MPSNHIIFCRPLLLLPSIFPSIRVFCSESALHIRWPKLCSPGHAGKEGPQLARTGASQGFPRAAAPVGVFSLGTTRMSGSLACGARAVSWRRVGSPVLGHRSLLSCCQCHSLTMAEAYSSRRGGFPPTRITLGKNTEHRSKPDMGVSKTALFSLRPGVVLASPLSYRAVLELFLWGPSKAPGGWLRLCAVSVNFSLNYASYPLFLNFQ